MSTEQPYDGPPGHDTYHHSLLNDADSHGGPYEELNGALHGKNQKELLGGKKSKAKKVKAVKGTKGPNKWLVHVANVKAANPEMSYKEVLVHAKGSYIKS